MSFGHVNFMQANCTRFPSSSQKKSLVVITASESIYSTEKENDRHCFDTLRGLKRHPVRHFVAATK
uniref:Uncharacterized protein n=1 Tax=Anguilla anguilla TaxID=7936 RepID=A0A0E9X5M0_ANGAN